MRKKKYIEEVVCIVRSYCLFSICYIARETKDTMFYWNLLVCNSET